VLLGVSIAVNLVPCLRRVDVPPQRVWANDNTVTIVDGEPDIWVANLIAVGEDNYDLGVVEPDFAGAIGWHSFSLSAR